jgi:hypothetical protein
MPTDASSGEGTTPAADEPGDDLVFAVQDLGRERAVPPFRHSGLVAARPAGAAPAPEVIRPAAEVTTPSREVTTPVPVTGPDASSDGFLIREVPGAAPAAAVDALVVGAPEPLAIEPQGEAGAAPMTFKLSSAAAVRPPAAEELWTTRHPHPQAAAPRPAPRRGWSPRQSDVDRSAHAIMLRLREEAVNVSWKSAWIAVTTSEPRRRRRPRSR